MAMNLGGGPEQNEIVKFFVLYTERLIRGELLLLYKKL